VRHPIPVCPGVSRQSSPTSNGSYIELFAGVGGIRLGFYNETGNTCVFASEFDKFCQETYAANFGEVPHGDVTRIDPASIPPFNTLLAGFPCQPFSAAGRRRGFEDPRGNAFCSIVTILRCHLPPLLLLENVKGLLTHDGGTSFKTIIEPLNDLGYRVHHQLLDAKDFGLPQSRSRIFIIGLRGNSADFSFPVGAKSKTRLGDILDSNVPEKYTLSDRAWEGLQIRKLQNQADGKGFGYRLYDENSAYVGAITARYHKGPDILVNQRRGNPRMLTPREVARIQGFPDSFIIPVGDRQAYAQLGNSVAIPVIRAISRQAALSMSSGRS
jgi:DNA (cytosine-5)-methyltransferase 1